MCAFIPKCHSFPFFVWCISGSRCFALFFVDVGAAMSVASHNRPLSELQPLRCKMSVDLLEQLHPERVPLQQVAEVQDRRLVRQCF